MKHIHKLAQVVNHLTDYSSFLIERFPNLIIEIGYTKTLSVAINVIGDNEYLDLIKTTFIYQAKKINRDVVVVTDSEIEYKIETIEDDKYEEAALFYQELNLFGDFSNSSFFSFLT